jgi:cell division protein FtsB
MITYALGFGAFVLFVNALVGDNGYLAALRTSREQALLAETLQNVNLDNEQLQTQIRRLRDDHDPTALEEAARRYLNLIKPGETLVIIKDAKPAAQPPSAPAGK